ncbi:hypothetical protein EB118_23060 [bacterium]|nr:hypothetical protein [bacterium]
MASYSMKKGGKEIGPASTYAEPHTMKGKKVSVEENPGKRMNENVIERDWQPLDGVGIGGNKGIKTSGIKMRGAGAATKGTMSRGPMA